MAGTEKGVGHETGEGAGAGGASGENAADEDGEGVVGPRDGAHQTRKTAAAETPIPIVSPRNGLRDAGTGEANRCWGAFRRIDDRAVPRSLHERASGRDRLGYTKKWADFVPRL